MQKNFIFSLKDKTLLNPIIPGIESILRSEKILPDRWYLLENIAFNNEENGNSIGSSGKG